MDNKPSNKNVVPPVKEEQKEKKETSAKPAPLIRYSEIEEKVEKAIEAKDVDTVLLLNELTFARNFSKNGLSKSAQKEFSVVYVAFKSNNEVIKRAGIYNTKAISDPEKAEDVLIAEDFANSNVLAIPRNSIFIAEFLK